MDQIAELKRQLDDIKAENRILDIAMAETEKVRARTARRAQIRQCKDAARMFSLARRCDSSLALRYSEEAVLCELVISRVGMAGVCAKDSHFRLARIYATTGGSL
jgi:hypothetical protein